ncbi:uncharacterized protein LOC100890603 isoform X2 [Strongylocentrotus purpuratus]|uniref:Uncharacterized protein n=1 Tax=Strongylocentrotus purpuratus TaxID=7668 RepID=A0A7M7PL07_STRPU|nr:uncharacterized protein LOC100890603 isoform X2 [Strongylocentrotus purpuratus]
MFVGIVILVLNVLRSVSSQPSADEWYRLDDALYLVDNTSRLNYDDAQSQCLEYGANLARVDSDEIQSFLTTFISPPSMPTRCFWIGCHDREVEGQFKWLDGTQVRYNGWASYQPDDHGENQDCACLWSSKNPNRHGRWDDNTCGARLDLICQKGVYNFTLTSSRSNPGSAYVSCAVDVVQGDQTLSPNDVRVSVGKNVSSTTSIPYSSTNVNGGLRNNSFVIDSIQDDDKIFCHVGKLARTERSFSRVDLSPINFYALPGLTSGPSVEDISSTFVTVSWSSWIPCLDTGEGPVVSYLVYLQTMDGEWVEGGGIDSDVGEGDLQRRMEFVLTGLEPGNEYNISVSAVREGVGGEGPKGPLVSVTTSIESGSLFGALGKSNLIWILFGVSLAGNILLVVVIVITWRQRKQQKKKTLPNLSRAPSGHDPKDHQYEVPRAVGDGDDHIYEGLQRTESSINKESSYLSIDNTDRVEYVNTNI